MSPESREIQERVNLLVSSSPELTNGIHGFSFTHTSADMFSKRVVTVVGRLCEETQRAKEWIIERKDEWQSDPREHFRLLEPPFIELRDQTRWRPASPKEIGSLSDELWYICSPTSIYKTEKIENSLYYAALLERPQMTEQVVVHQLHAAS